MSVATGKIRLASLGVGGWGRVLADAAVDSGHATIAAAYARSAEARERFAADYSSRAAATVEEVLEDPDIDGVLIATPHRTHADLVVRAAHAGKHVLVEKPLTLTLADAQRCVDAAADARIVLAVGHNRRRQTAIRRIRHMIDDGHLGLVHHVDAHFTAPTAFSWPPDSWRRNAAEMPAGGMTVMGVHMVDTMHYLLGLPNTVYARSKRIAKLTDVDEATALLLEFDSGPLAFLGTSTVLPPAVTIGVRGSEAAVWSEEDGGRLFFQRRDQRARSEIPIEPNDPIAEQVAEFVRCIRDGGEPECNGAAGLEVVRVLEAAVESARTDCAVKLR